MFEEHRCILESDKKWLGDAIINAVQYLLHSQYGMPGFQATTLGYHLTFDIMRKGFIQILHNGEDHWFTISTLGLPSGHVHIYDSHYNTCTDHGIEQICSLFILLTMQRISISWMLINRLIIQTVACMPLRMPLIYAVTKMCVLGNMTQY